VGKEYSVLMSIYYKENPDFFKLSIESMLNQTLTPEQIVIVKDGKLAEGLDQIINQYTTAHPNLFTIVALEENVGLGLALNEGLKVCRNELVARMDTDDISLPERCELQVAEFIKNEKLCIVGTMIDEFIDDPNVIVSSRIVPTTHEEILKFSRRRNPFSHPSVMYRKSKVLEVGGYDDYKLFEDYALWVKMIKNASICKNLDKALLLMRGNSNMFKRRGGFNYFKCILRFRVFLLRNKSCSIIDFLITAGGHGLIALVPNSIRTLFYKKFLRMKG
jgi:glycosyltransferase involved in cell wall biosynthesis